MEQWYAFLDFEFANEILIVVGALMVLFGVMKILGSSIRLLLWVILAGIGGFAVAYGVERTGSDLPINLTQELRSFIGPGRELSVDAMRVLCDRLDAENPG